MNEAVRRAADMAGLGHRPSLTPAEVRRLHDTATGDPDGRVRAAALGALVRRAGPDATSALARASSDPDAAVRRRAAELAPGAADPAALVHLLVAALDDRDVTVVEAACWALGELPATVARGAVGPLARVARDHRDALAREAAVAALGALGDEEGLPAILAACADKPAVRRRAVLALAPFSGPEVDAALAAAMDDRDWQVRQAAEDLTRA